MQYYALQCYPTNTISRSDGYALKQDALLYMGIHLIKYAIV